MSRVISTPCMEWATASCRNVPHALVRAASRLVSMLSLETITTQKSVETSLDTARTSACATKYNDRMNLRIAILVALQAIAFAQPPATPKKPLVDEYHGVPSTVDYQSLENSSH